MANIVDWFAVGVAIFAIAHNAWATTNIVWAKTWLLRARRVPLPNAPQTFFVLLLPMIEEQDLAEEAINHFLELDYPGHLLRIVAITSAREQPHNGRTTRDVIESLIAMRQEVRLLHFCADGSDTTKADQMNQGLKWLDLASPHWWSSEVVVGVYDADSRPETQTLRDVDRAARANPDACVFQQPALYVSGFDNLPTGLRGAYLRSRPIYNWRFHLYRELPAFSRSIAASRTLSPLLRALFASPNHLLGHGEFIRQRTLRWVGDFPSPSADTSLGTILSFQGFAVVPLSTFDIGESPTSVRMLIRQGATWYAGCSLYLRDLRFALANGTRLAPQHFLMAFKRWLENMIWCIGPLLMLFAGAWALYREDPSLALMWVTGLALHALSVHQTLLAYIALAADLQCSLPLPTPRLSQCILTLILYPVMLLGTCLGPLLHYAFALRKVLTGRPIPRSKTVRASESAPATWSRHRNDTLPPGT